MSVYDVIESPAQPEAAVEAVRDLIATGSDIVQNRELANGDWMYLESSDYVFGNRYEVDLSTDLPDRFVVVRLEEPAGGHAANHAKRVDAHVQVMAGCRRVLSNGQRFDRPERWHAAIHKRVHDKIVGKRLTLRVGTVELPVRIARYQSRVDLDAEMDFYFSTVIYGVTQAGI